MLGMSLSEYEKYCKNLKVSNEKEEENTNDFLEYLDIDESLLKTN